MIHQYKSHGYNIVMDVNSSAVHVVDDVVYDMIPVYEKQEDKEAIFASLDSYLSSKLPLSDGSSLSVCTDKNHPDVIQDFIKYCLWGN